jgi:hypothetical protein
MVLRNSKSNIRNINFRPQSLDYQRYSDIKERLGQNKEHSIRIKLNP